jgi:hypothetical protein
MTKHSTHSFPEVPPPGVPLDQTKAFLDWEGREPPSEERREAWDFRLIRFLSGQRRWKNRRSR